MAVLYHLALMIAAIGTFTFARHGALSVEASFGASIALVIVLVIAGEIALGRREPNVSKAEARTDLAYTLLTAIVSGLLSTAFTLGAVSLAGIGWLWPSQWPFFLQAAAALLLAELANYWMHRLVHRVELLYRFHEVHHSSTALHWLNGGRFHPIDTLFFQLASTAPLILLGAPPAIVALAGLVGQTGNYLQHTKVPIDGGWLNRFLHTSLAHRIHHREDACTVRNFGGALLVWDWMFGTHEAPSAGRPRLGPGRAYPEGLWKQLLEPFRPR
jgi:lathosterol oxidase